MRLPKLRQLTVEQKDVYLYAPTDRHVLVQGPPGTGKTLIACLRAIELQKKDVPVVLGVFNQVLARFSSNVHEGGQLPTQTVYRWFKDWWSSSGLPPHPQCDSILIEVPFADKDAVKALGATWDPEKKWRPWGRKQGAWGVQAETYFSNPEPFHAWRLWHGPPTVDGNHLQIDWKLVADHILEHDEKIRVAALNLGTVLIDEGQDFPRDFYRALWNISAVAASRGSEVEHRPRCFVLADENQQLTNENSTLKDIVEALKISEDCRFQLLDNFRNSREIALLARSFFADVGVLPNLPARKSEKPVFSLVGHVADVSERVKTWLTNNPGKEVGVLVFNEDKRATVFSQLGTALSGVRGRSITVQTYSSKSRKENPSEALLFDAPDVVTVLNMQSCKGLEFDAVFIVDLNEAQIGLYGPDRFKMQMFVATSRGREWVELIDSGRHAGQGSYVSFLPGEDVLERDTAPRREHRGSAQPGPKSDTTVPGGAVVAADEWQTQIKRIAKEKNLAVEDLRHKGGAVWVDGGAEMADFLRPLGFSYSDRRGAWWRK